MSGQVYEGLTYKLSFKFSSSYPYSAPTVKFETPCFHPNVDSNGNICLDILKEKWSAVYNVGTVLLSIQSLLSEPNNDSPLNGYAAALWENQVGTFLCLDPPIVVPTTMSLTHFILFQTSQNTKKFCILNFKKMLEAKLNVLN
jgi:hypothetical protein